MKNDNMQEYSLPFAAWELRLYLNTHPYDKEALAKYKAICAASGNKCNYACHVTDSVPGRRSYNDGCGCSSTVGRRMSSGCGCDGNNGRRIGDNGRRDSDRCGCDGGNTNGYVARRSDNGCNGCGCENNGCSDDNEVYNVWSWIEGPWPWEPEANNVGGNC